jgi:Flp pilus assembly pilin Flp
MFELARARLGSEEAQTLVEYSLILALIALVAIGGLTLVGTPNPGVFSRVATFIHN